MYRIIPHTIAYIQRRWFTLITLLFYYWFWTFVFSFWHMVANNPKKSCGAANAGMLGLMVVIIGAYLVTFSVIAAVYRGQLRKDFLLALLFLLLPVLAGIIDLFT